MKLKEIIHIFFIDIYVDLLLFSILFVIAIVRWEGTLWNTVGVGIFIASTILWIIARIQLGQSFSLLPEARTLVTKGLYSKLRHPMYLFSQLAFAGLVISLQNKYLLVILILFICIEYYRIQKENKKLLEVFGERYIEYKRKTWL